MQVKDKFLKQIWYFVAEYEEYFIFYKNKINLN